jgi:hypothetical protein
MNKYISSFPTPGLTDHSIGQPVATHIAELEKCIKGLMSGVEAFVARLDRSGGPENVDNFQEGLAYIMQEGLDEIESCAKPMPQIDRPLEFPEFWESANRSQRRHIEQSLLPTKAAIDTVFPHGIASVVANAGKSRKRKHRATLDPQEGDY